MTEKKKVEAKATLESMISLLGLTATVENEESERNIVLSLKSEDPGRLIGRNGQTVDALQLLINKMIRRAEDNCPAIILDVDGYKKARRERWNNRRKNGDNKAEKTDKPAKGPKVAAEKADATPEKAEKTEKPAKKETTNKPKAESKPKGDSKPRQKSKPRQEDKRNDRPSSLSDERVEAITKQAVEASKEVKRWGEDVTLPPMSGAERRIVHLALENDPEVTTESAEDSGRGKKRIVVKYC